MTSLASTTAYPSSHGEDEACEGGRSVYPSDSQTTLQKLLVVSSDDRDLADEMLESDTSGPVSSRTRKKRREKSQKASRPTVQESGDDIESVGEPGGSGATIGAQRGACLNDASQCQGEVSDIEQSDTEYAAIPRTWGSRMDMQRNSNDSDWLQCDAEVAIKNRRPHTARQVNNQNQSCQTEEPQRSSVKSVKHRGHEVFKPIRQSSDLAKGHSSRSMFKNGERAVYEEMSANSHRQAKYAETRSRPSARPMRAMQSEEYKNRSSVTECSSNSESEADSSAIPGQNRRKKKQGMSYAEDQFRSDRAAKNYHSSDENFSSTERKKTRRPWKRDYSFEQGDRKQSHRHRSAYGSETGRDRNRKSRGHMKPEKFDGNSCFETFLAQFNNCAQYNSWDVTEKLQYLRWSLTGVAARMLWGTEDMSYKELVARLRSRFGSLDMEEKYQAELQCRRRKPNESFRELAQDIRRLMMLAYPGDRSNMSERLAKEHFICAFDDPELELKVREKEPQTLDSALKYAQRLEVFRNAVRQRRLRMNRQVAQSPPSRSDSLEDRVASIVQKFCEPQQQTEKHSERAQHQVSNSGTNEKKKRKENKSRVRAAAVNNENAWKDELLEKIRKLEIAQQLAEAETKKFTAENDALNKEVERLRHLEQLRSVPAMAPHPVFVPSHGGQQRPHNRKCFNCGQEGHFANECPYPRAQMNAGVQFHSDGEMIYAAASKSPASTSVYRDAYLRISIGHRVYDCLLDTGSEVCLFPEHVVDSAVVKKTSRTLKAANGTVIPILGEVQLPVIIGQFTTQVTGLVSQHVSEPMLGIDFLVDNQVIWDFEQSTVCIGKVWHRLRSRPDRHHWCRRVILEQNVEIPSRSEVIVPTKVQFQRLPSASDGQDWSTEISCAKEGLHVSRTLIPRNVWTDVPVRVMNVKDVPISLESGSVIADLQPVDVIETENRRELNQSEDDSESVPEYIQKLIDGVDGSIPESSCLALRSILTKHADVFSENENDLGKTDIIMHHIDTGDARPVRQPLRRFPPAHIEAISDHVDNMLEQGTIEPASSPWASNVVLVKKKDGSYR